MNSFKKFIKIICILTAASLVCFGFAGCGEDNEDGDLGESEIQGSNTADSTSSEDNKVSIDSAEKGTPIAIIDIKDYGKITVLLDPKSAPITVSNFVKLAEAKFYDGLTFHRIMEGFMMQGGDPKGDGTGGSDQNIKGEFAQNGVKNSLSHTRGAISMARGGYSMDSASSQFFIVHKDSTFLDGQYACFGYVADGMDVVDKVCTTAKPIDDNGTIPKSKQPIINSVRIEYKQ